MCAKEAENCRADYLMSRNLEGCCDGTLCRLSSAGIPVCQGASTSEIALFRKCKGDTTSQLANTPTKVSTSVGTFEYDRIGLLETTVGPAGCLNGVTLRIGNGKLGCEIALDVALHDGKLAVTRVFGGFDSCPGYTGDPFGLTGTVLVDDPTMIPFGFSFTGLSCGMYDASFESYGVAGTFDFQLQGTLEGVTFDSQHIVFEAVSRASGPAGTCPMP
jgi:hypothetical protein